ncbi:ATP-binding protein [Planobispora takensis]|uniref:Fused acetyl/propionyl-CoA carboxylase subuit alpha/methylmalonyl-CoA decarboxylase subunit alpha n=1 Tax=Planobispora takensis TaxID=1367882 RepID=A0A8J3T5H8_9ACTN|nr:carboxyl transferase domain-containing protein [Planobispora takensis]GII05556.1 fused acetyl/propionyl-CoA carboxylase subuit alpha/methylmalonyl-CoA decarboxylase subunit alpha [Planobispora takensis]
MPDIRRLAVVNRGEPANRVLDAVAELNREGVMPRMTTVVLHTDPDAGAWFSRMADEAVSMGPATYLDPRDGRRKSAYLDEERVMAAVLRARADAVWVGWGFLAEHASFARRCEEAGITFVGPGSATISLLGDKIAAKLLAEKAAVPVVPWSGGPVADTADALKHAEQLGYPVLIKAAAGGGGRGIRIVRRPEELGPALASARAEAEAAFGDAAVFAEQFVPRARHVEVQVIADAHGTVWAVGVRDCSIQRRNQKVIEESASTALTPDTEQQIREAAVRLARAAGYRNAGTVEFLVDPDTGRYLFMEVNTRLQVEHPVTEESAGLDLVKLQLHVAGGGRLAGEPPPVRGHAVEARLCAEDPEQGFTPAPGRIALWRPPAGPGIRVDAGVAEGDTVAPEFDSMIAKVVAWGRDRAEALARLRRALASTRVIIEGGATNRTFLLSLLAAEEVRLGTADNTWLDRLTAEAGHLPGPDPVALLQAAAEAYEADHQSERAAFHAAAGRGRPEVPQRRGHRVRLRCRGLPYELTVLRTGPEEYRVETADGPAAIRVERLGRYERRLTCDGVRHRVQVAAQGPSYLVEVERDGEWAAHRVHRDDGGIVRAAAPAFVVAVHAVPGGRVAEGDPLVVMESMKMESTLTAPFAGEVAGVDVAINTQVVEGQPLLRIRELPAAAGPVARAPVRFTGVHRAGHGAPGCGPVYAALRGCLLGFDLDPGEIDQRAVEAALEPDDEQLLACEEAFLDLFADVCGLYRPLPDPDEPEAASAQEYVLSYLQWLDPDRAGLPPGFRVRLQRVLARYGVPDLRRTPQLEEAVVWMFRAFQRAGDLVPAVAVVLERRLRHRDLLAPAAGPELRGLLDRLATAAQVRHPVLADLARDVRFRYFDEPQHDEALAAVYAEMEAHLDDLAADPGRPDREDLIDRLVWCPQPMRGPLLARWRGAGPAFRSVVTEIYIRRFYRTRPLERIGADGDLGTADFEHDGLACHLVVAYTPLRQVPAACAAIATHLAGVDPARRVIVELMTWRPGERPAAEQMQEQVARLLAGCHLGRDVERVCVTVTSEHGAGAEHRRTQHFAYRQRPDGFTEEPLYRNLHPMIAERAELWRLSNFELERLRSAEDVYLFRGTAGDNPADVRLFAMAEVRDLTPVRDSADRIVSLPRLERMGLQALAAMREALAAMPPEQRPRSNRIVLYVRPPFDVPRERWPELVRPFVTLAIGVGLEKVLLQVRIPGPDGGTRPAVLHLEGLDEDRITVREEPYGQAPIRPLSEYRRRVLRARRFGAPYPYEIVRMLAPPRGTPGDFPPGRFIEYDLDGDGALVPVERPQGRNTANLVVGVMSNDTAEVPEGMARIAILGDPTRSLGSLAEPECRRVIAALDLAERMRVPVEWFALSSGARIAMDSGTENMDWIAAVLRRLVEFTQAGGEVNVVVTGINVGAQPYWNAEATMLMHTRGILVMVAGAAMVLTGKQALDFSGGVSAEDNTGIGGFERIMGPNGQAQYGAATLAEACRILLHHYEHTYVVPGERYPRRRPSTDPAERDVRAEPHPGPEFTAVGEVFSAGRNAERKRPFDIRSVMRAVCDRDCGPLERWARWRDAEIAVVWDGHIGGIPVCLIGLASAPLPRHGFVPADGPPAWSAGTLFPQSSRKVARAINAASGNRPVVVLANLSGFDGSPESMRRWQLEYGAEIGRAVVNFDGPIVFVVISRYHGGAFVVFSKRLNPRLEIAAVEGSFASVIGGAPAAAVVFVREVGARTEQDPRVVAARQAGPRSQLHQVTEEVRAEKLREVAAEFDRVHSIQRALAVGSVDHVIPAAGLRPHIVQALERGMAAQ